MTAENTTIATDAIKKLIACTYKTNDPNGSFLGLWKTYSRHCGESEVETVLGVRMHAPSLPNQSIISGIKPFLRGCPFDFSRVSLGIRACFQLRKSHPDEMATAQQGGQSKPRAFRNCMQSPLARFDAIRREPAAEFAELLAAFEVANELILANERVKERVLDGPGRRSQLLKLGLQIAKHYLLLAPTLRDKDLGVFSPLFRPLQLTGLRQQVCLSSEPIHSNGRNSCYQNSDTAHPKRQHRNRGPSGTNHRIPSFPPHMALLAQRPTLADSLQHAHYLVPLWIWRDSAMEPGHA